MASSHTGVHALVFVRVFAEAFTAVFFAALAAFFGFAESAVSVSLARAVGTPVFFSGATNLPRAFLSGSAAAPRLAGWGPAWLLYPLPLPPLYPYKAPLTPFGSVILSGVMTKS